MSNEVHAKAAMDHARKMLGEYKSANKSRPGFTKNTHIDRAERLKRADKALRESRAQVKSHLQMMRVKDPSEKMEVVANYAEYLKVGNCTEYAAVAWQYLVGKEVRAHVIGLEGGDHVFTAVGLASQPSKQFAQWGDDVWICDPWAKICCKASDYPTQWAQKMSKWDSSEKKILTEDGAISPTSHAWLNSVTHCEKSIRAGAPFEAARPTRERPTPPPKPHAAIATAASTKGPPGRPAPVYRGKE